MPDIKLAEGMETQGLPEMLATLLKQNLEQKPHRIKDFNALNITVGLKVVDIEMELRLIFKKGLLIIDQGLVNNPEIIIIAFSENLFDLNCIRIKFGIPWYFDSLGIKTLKGLFSGRIKIKGMLTHLISLIRLTKIMSVY